MLFVLLVQVKQQGLNIICVVYTVSTSKAARFKYCVVYTVSTSKAARFKYCVVYTVSTSNSKV